MTNPMSDIAENAQAIFIIGSNTTEQHPVFGYKLRQAVLQRGAKLVVADPRNIQITDFATLHLRHKPGTDVALVNGLAHIILKNGWEDRESITKRTEGFKESAESLDDYTPEVVAEITGLTIAELVGDGHHPAHYRGNECIQLGKPANAFREYGSARWGNKSFARPK